MLRLNFIWSEIPMFVFGSPGISQSSQTQPKKSALHMFKIKIKSQAVTSEVNCQAA